MFVSCNSIDPPSLPPVTFTEKGFVLKYRSLLIILNKMKCYNTVPIKQDDKYKQYIILTLCCPYTYFRIDAAFPAEQSLL